MQHGPDDLLSSLQCLKHVRGTEHVPYSSYPRQKKTVEINQNLFYFIVEFRGDIIVCNCNNNSKDTRERKEKTCTTSNVYNNWRKVEGDRARESE